MKHKFKQAFMQTAYTFAELSSAVKLKVGAILQSPSLNTQSINDTSILQYNCKESSPFDLGFFGSHNASLSISKNTEILEVVEVERFIDKKNADLIFTDNTINEHRTTIKNILKYFAKKYQATHYNTVYWNFLLYMGTVITRDNDLPDTIKDIFPAKNFMHCSHHVAHANSAFYQSPFHQALIISFDGGGDDGVFNVYIGEKNKDLFQLYRGSNNLCIPYSMIGHYISEIKHEYNLSHGQLTYPGKLMGLACEGSVSRDIEHQFVQYFRSSSFKNELTEALDLFAKCLNITNDVKTNGTTSAHFAATAQHVFESLCYEELRGFLNASHKLPIVLTGGGALNIINNSQVESLRKVFVPPNPSDCGIAVGMLCSVFLPTTILDCTYIGPEVWDKDDLEHIVAQRNGIELDLNKIADGIISGEIYGVVQGRSEHGPRALGNRSILASAVIPEMKDILNSKIKGRESFRPFAPVVRLEDVSKYFNRTIESRHMSYSVKIHPQYLKKLYAVASGNGTARVQTVTRDQNALLYDLLTILDKKTGDGILLNTSFNLDGKPILNRYSDALEFLDTKDIHGVIFEKYFIRKSNET